MLEASAWAALGAWMALSGCGMGAGASGCGPTSGMGASAQPNCATGYYAKQNSDGSYGPCQPMPAPGSSGGH